MALGWKDYRKMEITGTSVIGVLKEYVSRTFTTQSDDWRRAKVKDLHNNATEIDTIGAVDAFIKDMLTATDALQAKLDAAAALVEADYDSTSWAALQTQVTASQTVQDDPDSTATDKDTSATDLQAAIDALVPAA